MFTHDHEIESVEMHDFVEGTYALRKHKHYYWIDFIKLHEMIDKDPNNK